MNTSMKTHIDKYKSTDLETATILLTSGFTDFDIYEIGPKHFEFQFNRTTGLDRILEAYHKQQLTLPAFALLANWKFLKTRINERKCQSTF